jgi:hypothetical protein
MCRIYLVDLDRAEEVWQTQTTDRLARERQGAQQKPSFRGSGVQTIQIKLDSTNDLREAALQRELAR